MNDSKISFFVILNTEDAAADAYLHTHETKRRQGRHQMRIVLIVACAVALGFSAWANLPADAGQHAGAPTVTTATE